MSALNVAQINIRKAYNRILEDLSKRFEVVMTRPPELIIDSEAEYEHYDVLTNTIVLREDTEEDVIAEEVAHFLILNGIDREWKGTFYFHVIGEAAGFIGRRLYNKHFDINHLLKEMDEKQERIHEILEKYDGLRVLLEADTLPTEEDADAVRKAIDNPERKMELKMLRELYTETELIKTHNMLYFKTFVSHEQNTIDFRKQMVKFMEVCKGIDAPVIRAVCHKLGYDLGYRLYTRFSLDDRAEVLPVLVGLIRSGLEKNSDLGRLYMELYKFLLTTKEGADSDSDVDESSSDDSGMAA